MADPSPIFDPSNTAAFAAFVNQQHAAAIATQQAAAGRPVSTFDPFGTATRTTSSSSPGPKPKPISSPWETITSALGFGGSSSSSSSGGFLSRATSSLGGSPGAAIGQPLMRDESLTGQGGSGDDVLDKLAKFIPPLTINTGGGGAAAAPTSSGPDLMTIAVVGGVALVVVVAVIALT